jgi:hypothetical protein
MALLQQRKLASRPFPAAAGMNAAAAGAQRQAQAAGTSIHSNRSSISKSSGGGAAPGAENTTASGSAILPSCVAVKRQDGSCCSRLRVTGGCSIAELQATIQQVEVSHLALNAGCTAAAGMSTLCQTFTLHLCQSSSRIRYTHLKGSFIPASHILQPLPPVTLSSILQGVAPTHLSFCQAQDSCLHVVWGPSTDSSSNSHTVYSRSSMPQTTMLVSRQGQQQCDSRLLVGGKSAARNHILLLLAVPNSSCS